MDLSSRIVFGGQLMLISTAADVGVGALVGFGTADVLACKIEVVVICIKRQPFPVELTTNPELHANEVGEQVAAGGH